MFNVGEIAKSVMKRDKTGTAAFIKMFENSDVEFVTQGNFTIALLRVPVKKVDGVTAIRIVPGVSKRNGSDAPNQRRGKMLALARAIRNTIDDLVVATEIERTIN